ncbi:MAG: DNA transposition protein [Alphaproteobacteria bacterium]|nr:DNA transposition protein [Alphaproteobacteria bacterium]MBF0251149.1 DNA transposition protein [Alphaproteobacteria bacterium]
MTLDILEDWTPPEVVKRYQEERVRTSTLRAKIARAVAETLHDSENSRDDIATAMSEWLGEDVTKNMLNNYASEAQEDHTIPYLRLLALVQVTGDVRLLQVGAEMFGHVVADAKYLDWIRVGMEADLRDQATTIAEERTKEFDLALRNARKRGV